MDFIFFINCILLGFGLAMDAFSVSLANGINEHNISKGKTSFIAGIFGCFQGIMPMMGWICVTTVAEYFSVFEKFVPWIALILLWFIGGKTLIEGIRSKDAIEQKSPVKFGGIIIQGVATSIDALSVGFTIANHTLIEAIICCSIIGVITFILCLIGVNIGKKVGSKFSNKAGIIGGVILILIGIEIFITSLF
jgi:putative Mn2+ efflux pump MntP